VARLRAIRQLISVMRQSSMKRIATLGFLFFSSTVAEAGPSHIRSYVEAHCLDCHDGEDAKAGLDLSGLGLALGDRKTFESWVKVYDRVSEGEMPPGKKRKPPATQTKQFLTALADPLVATDLAREAAQGRSTRRRLNRHEYENTLRDLFVAPWLQLKDLLPEDGESHRFNKVGDALDVSFVQMAQYLAVAEEAIRQVIRAEGMRPEFKTTRYYAREMKSFVGPMRYSEFNRSADRATFPVLGFAAQPDVRAGTQPMTVGASDPATRELEGMGVIASSYEPIEPKFDQFKAPTSGLYKLRLRAHSVWLDPNGLDWHNKRKPWEADLDKVSRGRRSEPVTLYARSRSGTLRRLDAVDVEPDPTVREIAAYLSAGETIQPDPSRLFRSRPPKWKNPLATAEGIPGVVFRSLEVEGPILEQWPTAGSKLLFGDLGTKRLPDGEVEYVSQNPEADAQRLMDAFLRRAYRRPATSDDLKRFMAVVERARGTGASFTESMVAGYIAVLCSPRFVYLEEEPGTLDDMAVAARLSYFLWNSRPDDALQGLAASGTLHRPDAIATQVERMLKDPRSERFIDAFLNYWLDLRKITATSPDADLYPDYYLDDLLLESSTAETRAFFAELLSNNLPTRNLIQSNFVMINERLADHYGIAGIKGVAIRKVAVPRGSPRGGLLTQASVLKVTANGTTTSPVLRGVWIRERVLGQPVPPPPPGVPAVEPDIRGAQTIREQLKKHRADPKCASCHIKIDPPGFALESFDIFGGWRDKYRAVGTGDPVKGIGKAGHDFKFHMALPADASGVTPSGQNFKNVFEWKKLFLREERQVARNLVQQLVVYATGAPVRFGDRARVEAILDRAKRRQYGVRTLLAELAKSELFLRK
jgi:Protein of unknown function (DUF1592)/Protein of unknown function (DUF1588)/Protein of unknown function (DUF1587)/Protein of unknown function (DUF1595)/Protein of unknown function (DUF1585)/Planctomycete cytochrome C